MSSQSEKIKKEILTKLRSLSENITDSVGQMSQGKPVFCSAEVVNKRLGICKACPEYVAATSQCRKCGCFMSAKTKLKVSSCPINKWSRDT